MIRSNPHTHTDYVDGKSSACEQIGAAIKLGFESLGFSEHAFEGDNPVMCGLKKEDRHRYLSEIGLLQQKYDGRIRIWLGMEIDRISPESGEGLDYFIGASHYFQAQDGTLAAIDGDPDVLENFVRMHFDGSWERAIKTYFEEYAAYIEHRPPSIIAHFDLIRKNNTKRQWFQDKLLLEPGRAAMRRMIRKCDLMEINLGGMLRSNQKTPYPMPDLLAYWHSLGGRVIPSTECHNSALLAGNFDYCEEYMKQAGYSEYTVLGTGDQLFEMRTLA